MQAHEQNNLKVHMCSTTLGFKYNHQSF